MGWSAGFVARIFNFSLLTASFVAGLDFRLCWSQVYRPQSVWLCFVNIFHSRSFTFDLINTVSLSEILILKDRNFLFF